MNKMIRLGTRGSALACWQTERVAELLRGAWPDLCPSIEVITTRGDRILDEPLPLIGGKGLFTDELERALRSREIDLAVHSLKDLPVEGTGGLVIGAVPARANPADVLVSRGGYRLDTLPAGAVVGTSSHRRTAQLKHQRPDLKTVSIRGNVDTRIRKALDPGGPYDAIVLAYAGLERLGRLDVIGEVLPLEMMLPAPGQAALAVQCRNEPDILALLEPVNHQETQLAVCAERAFLSALGGGCSVPVAALATVAGSNLTLHGRVTALGGSRQVDVSRTLVLPDNGRLSAARQMGMGLALEAISQGANMILKAASHAE